MADITAATLFFNVKNTEVGQLINLAQNLDCYDLYGHAIEVGENMKMVVKRFMDSGMSMEETSKRMDMSIPDLEKLLNS